MRTVSLFFGDHALDERLVGVERVVEHHDIAALRIGEAIGELVDDQPILIGQRRRHALAFDPRDLEAERDDQRGVDRGRGQRLDPGDELVAPQLEAADDHRRTFLELAPRGTGPAAANAACVSSRSPRPLSNPPNTGGASRGSKPGNGCGCSAPLSKATGSGSRSSSGRVYSFRYSRRRRVCDRLTGISVAFASFILRM